MSSRILSLMTVVSAFLTFSALTANANVQTQSDAMTLDQRPIIEEVPVTQIFEGPTDMPGGVGSGLCPANSGTHSKTGVRDGVDEIDYILDKILNMGKKIWEIIDAGQPVIDLKVDVATALPQGARCWNDLELWARPLARQYRVIYKNNLGAEVVRYEFQIQWLSGGRVKSQGRYVGYAAVIPVNVYAVWGFKLFARNSVASVFNVGSSLDPIGAIQMTMNWRVKAPFQKFEQALTFYVDGEGKFELLKAEDVK